MQPRDDTDRWVPRDLGVVRVEGVDRIAFLQSLLSQDLESAPPGTAADFLFLDAKGNARASGRAVVLPDTVLLVVPAALVTELADTLANSTFLLQATIEALQGWQVVSVRGPDVSLPALVPAVTDPARLPVLAQGEVILVRDRSGGLDIAGPGGTVDRFVGGLGLPPGDAADWEAWRIHAGEPAWGAEIAPGQRAQELGLLPTHVHLKKGCYPGQESIAKTYNLGRPRRALVLAEVAAPVAPGAVLETVNGAGKVTSAVLTDEGARVLALVPLDKEGGSPALIERPPGRVLRRIGDGLPQPGAAIS